MRALEVLSPGRGPAPVPVPVATPGVGPSSGAPGEPPSLGPCPQFRRSLHVCFLT